MQRSLVLDPKKCTGCMQCEMACSLENEGFVAPSRSRIRVFAFHDEGRFAPLVVGSQWSVATSQQATNNMQQTTYKLQQTTDND